MIDLQNLSPWLLLVAPVVIVVRYRIHLGLTQEKMRRAVGALLVLTGASLLVRTFL